MTPMGSVHGSCRARPPTSPDKSTFEARLRRLQIRELSFERLLLSSLRHPAAFAEAKLPEKQKIGDDIKKIPKNRERWQQMGTCELTALEGAVGS
ncbi:hypothetical protein ACU4GI_26270 [Cupriavidus basilensis]